MMATHEQWTAWIEELRRTGLADRFRVSMDNDPAVWAEASLWRRQRRWTTDPGFDNCISILLAHAFEPSGQAFTAQWARRAGMIVVEAAYPGLIGVAENQPIAWPAVMISPALPADTNPLVAIARRGIEVLKWEPASPAIWRSVLAVCRKGFEDLAIRHRAMHAVVTEWYESAKGKPPGEPRPGLIAGMQLQSGSTLMYGTVQRPRRRKIRDDSVVENTGVSFDDECGVLRAVRVYGESAASELFDKLAARAGRALLNMPESMWRPWIAQQTMQMLTTTGVDTDRWLMALLDLSWNVPAMRRDESKRRAWFWNERGVGMVTVALDQLSVLRGKDCAFKDHPFADQMKRIADPPDHWFAVIPDLAALSVTAIDVLGNVEVLEMPTNDKLDKPVPFKSGARITQLPSERAIQTAQQPKGTRGLAFAHYLVNVCGTMSNAGRVIDDPPTAYGTDMKGGRVVASRDFAINQAFVGIDDDSREAIDQWHGEVMTEADSQGYLACVKAEMDSVEAAIRNLLTSAASSKVTPFEARVALSDAIQQCERRVWPQIDRTASKLVEPDAINSEPKSRPLTDQQRDIWNALQNQSLSAKQLAEPKLLNTSQDAIRNAISQMRRDGVKILTRHGVGYYRPDALPADWVWPA